jgi:hypothetical protein
MYSEIGRPRRYTSGKESDKYFIRSCMGSRTGMVAPAKGDISASIEYQNLFVLIYAVVTLSKMARKSYIIVSRKIKEMICVRNAISINIPI